MQPPRPLEQRKSDALARLRAQHADLWVASSSSAGEPHLVPLSFAWDGEHIIIASEAKALTTRNILSSRRARIGLGDTRDVVVIDVILEADVAVSDAAAEIADRYAEQADWDPRVAYAGYVYMLLRPDRMQVWREANELVGRTVMRGGEWLV